MKRGKFVILHLLTLHDQNRKREVCEVLRYRKAISNMTISSVTQGYQHHAILVIQTIPLAPS